MRAGSFSSVVPLLLCQALPVLPLDVQHLEDPKLLKIVVKDIMGINYMFNYTWPRHRAAVSTILKV